MYSNNPEYKLEGEFNGVKVYTLVKETDYHTYRYIEALNWQTYANCGTTKEKLTAIMDKILELCNEDKPSKTYRTDIGALANVVKYSMKYPVEEHCAIRVGAILSFCEYEINGTAFTEPHNEVSPMYIDKKVQLALNDPDAYSFFLGWGIANIPEYRTHFDISTATDYLTQRRQAIQMMLPEHLRHLTN
jgi:hypothetical protein